MGYHRTSMYGKRDGSEFMEDLTEVKKLIGLRITWDKRVDSIQCQWEMENGEKIWGDVHGGSGGKHTNDIDLTETSIARVKGSAGAMIDNLTFFAPDGEPLGNFGDGGGGKGFDVQTPGLGGLFGWSGKDLNAIGFFYAGK